MREQDLTPLERALLAAVRAGEGFGPAAFDGAAPPDADDPAHDIRAAVLEGLIDGVFGGPPIGRAGLRVAGVRIMGALNLSGAVLDAPLMLVRCRFTHAVTLDRMRAPAIALAGGHLQAALSAKQITVDADWVLDDLTAPSIACPEALVGGQLSMNRAALTASEDGKAFKGQGLHAAQGAFFGGLTATGTVDLNTADIGGQLSMEGAKLNAGEDGIAFKGQGLHAAQGAFLNGLTAKGTVTLNGADIGGQLSMEGAKLNAGEDGIAFNGQGLRAAQGVFFDNLTATGTVALNGTEIGGQLAMEDSTLTAGKAGEAFNGHGLRAAQGAFLRGLTATGTVNLHGANIGEQLSMTGATLTANEAGTAFKGQALRAAGGVFLDTLTAEGTVRFYGAQISVGFQMPGARFTAAKGVALDLEGARVDAIDFRDLSANCAGVCNLPDARLDTLVLGDGASRWPAGFQLRCPDVRIGALPGYRRAVRDGWIDWLAGQKPWAPHAYQQVAARLREGGHEDCAKAVYIAMRRRQRVEEHETFLETIPEPFRDERFNYWYFMPRLKEWGARLFDKWVLERVIGYGYRPMRAVYALVGLILMGTAIFHGAAYHNLIAPAQATVFKEDPDATPFDQGWGPSFHECAGDHERESLITFTRTPGERACLPDDYPSFIPLTYSFDLAIPLLEMRPEKFWTVNSSAPWGWLVLVWYYAQIILGSLLTGLFLAAVTGIVKKE